MLLAKRKFYHAAAADFKVELVSSLELVSSTESSELYNEGFRVLR